MKRLRLVAFDMEGVLTDHPTVWEIMHRRIGTWESHGLRYWDLYRAGRLAYDDFARRDVACWRGATVKDLIDAASQAPLMPGASELLAELVDAGVAVAIISNGLMRAAARFRDEHGVQHIRANAALHSDRHLTGELDLRVPYAAKGEVLRSLARELGVEREAVVAIGDGRADIAMFRQAGVSVAFCAASMEVRQAATHAVHERDLALLRALLLE